jgi:signal transduction histidine kinase
MSQQTNTTKITLNTGIDLAFALVVFVTFFTAFSTSAISSIFLILVIVCLGVAFLSNGIYGFSFARRSSSFFVKLVYLIVQLLIGGLIVYYGRGAGFSSLILLPIVAHTAILFDQDWALIANAAILLSFGISTWSYAHSGEEIWTNFPTFFVGQVFILIFTQMALTEQKARQRLEILAQELAEANKHLSDYADQVHDLAIAKERNRFAREIHDGLGQYLTTIHMQLNAASVVLESDPKEAGHILANAKKMSVEALEDVRQSVYALRKDSLEIADLVTRIRRLADDLTSDNRRVNLQVIGSPRELIAQADHTIFRTAQEGLNNAVKYSQASEIEILLDYHETDHINLSIKDNGIGSENTDVGFGLMGIQERTRLLNGEVRIESSPGKGFQINIRLPG